jgi:hypothetical protein
VGDRAAEAYNSLLSFSKKSEPVYRAALNLLSTTIDDDYSPASPGSIKISSRLTFDREHGARSILMVTGMHAIPTVLATIAVSFGPSTDFPNRRPDNTQEPRFLGAFRIGARSGFFVIRLILLVNRFKRIALARLLQVLRDAGLILLFRFLHPALRCVVIRDPACRETKNNGEGDD